MKRKTIIKIKKIAAIIAVFLVLFAGSPTLALAQSIPTPPPVPTAPPAPTPPGNEFTPPPAPTAPPAPTMPPAPTLTPPPAPTAPPAPTVPPVPTSTPTPSPVSSPTPISSPTASPTVSPSPSPSSTPSSDAGSGGQSSDGGSGGATVASGDANNSAAIVNDVNNNSAGVSGGGSGSGVSVVNDGNGADSTNTGSATIVDSDNTSQINGAVVVNTLNQTTDSGDNSASKNTGGDNVVTSGDANTTGSIVNLVNTNVDGVAVYEFNIADDQNGDYVLDFSQANCVSGCAEGDLLVANTGNGADSTNSGSVNNLNSDTSFQQNDATVVNNMYLASDSGDNAADKNTGGDNFVTSGDANVAGNVANFVNNNIAGDVVYAVVNVFGTLIGDIVLPDGTILSCCATTASAQNSGNGAGSTNNASLNNIDTNATNQFNTADIQNNLVFDANTGDNDVSKNTNGSSSVTTGEANVIAQVTNIANLNLVGGNYWLVIVNEAGRWLGRIVGAGDGAMAYGSDVFEFLLGDNGEISVVNSDNGADSTNTASVNNTTTDTTTQVNNASIVNNVNLSANTGGNSASKNTGGDSSVTSGDATVIANIVNFVNNNIIGSGKLFVVVVNVFGEWVGDFVGPGQTKTAQNESPNAENSALGGASSNQSNSGSQSQSSQEGGGAIAQGSGFAASGTFFAGQSKLVASVSSKILGTNVAGEVETAGNVISADAKDRIRINLAWGLLTLPLLLGYIVFKRKLRRSSAPAVNPA